jgi:(p)ppGpp synthase/HD superfamily hydrolase
MSMHNVLEAAIALACESHRGQTDKGGRPYILHPLRLMLGFDSTSEQVVAVLHDVVEDSSVTLEQLRELGFDSSVVDALDCLTRRRAESYDDFVDRVAGNPLATRVKLRDIQDNLDLSRLGTLNAEDLQRIAKYHRALVRLRATDAQQHRD